VVVSERSRGHGLVGAQTTDLAVAQAVVDQREQLAGDRDASLVGAAPLGDAMEIGLQLRAAFVAGARQRPVNDETRSRSRTDCRSGGPRRAQIGRHGAVT
jgi:hypothetical protein